MVQNDHERLSWKVEELEKKCAQLEQALRQREERFEKIFHASSMMTVSGPGEGGQLDIDEASACFGGYPRQEPIGQISAERRLFADPGRKRQLVGKLQENGKVQNLKMNVRTQGGELWTILLSADPVTVKDEPCLLGTAVNITAREEEAEALRKSEEQYRTLVENSLRSLRQALAWQEALFEGSRDAIFISDESAGIVAANAAACRLTGYSEQELLRMKASDLQNDPDLARLELLHSRILAGEDIYGEALITTKDGRRVDAEFGHQRVLISGVLYVHTIARDVSARKRLEAQLLQAQKMEAVGSLAGGAAHDFNNLLSVIKGYTELLLEEFDPEDSRRRDLEQIEKAAQRAVSLTSQLLAFSRKQILQPEILDLNAAINDMSTMLRRLIGEDIELITIAKPDLGLINADPGQIQQVLMNLAVNARDAMPRGGKLTIETANMDFDDQYIRGHPMMEKGPYVMMAISDDGLGMDAATKARIFEPFFTTKEKGRGTGLGLSTVYGIVRQSNGFIWVYSEPGRGTTFKVYFPRVKGGTPQNAADGRFHHEAGGSETVLLVEDEQSVRSLAGRILREKGYVVLEAADGTEALRIAREFKDNIDLVLTDVVMPGISGTTLVARLESLRPGIKSLYVSGYTDNSIVDHGILDSSVAFLQKPFTVRSLTQKVREVIDASTENRRTSH